jgi:hypothetical protein
MLTRRKPIGGISEGTVDLITLLMDIDFVFIHVLFLGR